MIWWNSGHNPRYSVQMQIPLELLTHGHDSRNTRYCNHVVIPKYICILPSFNQCAGHIIISEVQFCFVKQCTERRFCISFAFSLLIAIVQEYKVTNRSSWLRSLQIMESMQVKNKSWSQQSPKVSSTNYRLQVYLKFLAPSGALGVTIWVCWLGHSSQAHFSRQTEPKMYTMYFVLFFQIRSDGVLFRG